VPADFRNRNDAKIAVLQLAFEQGSSSFVSEANLRPRGTKSSCTHLASQKGETEGDGWSGERGRRPQQGKVETAEPVGAIPRIGQVASEARRVVPIVYW